MTSPLLAPAVLTCSRREFLRVGGGLAVAGFLSAGLAAASRQTGRGRSCILVYLLGGPSHLDMFDLKPNAPAEVRGPFRPIATSVPGIEICEHLPRLAGMAEKYALVRSVSYPNSNHTPMIYYTLTGRATERPEQDNDIRPPLRTTRVCVTPPAVNRTNAPIALRFDLLPSSLRSSQFPAGFRASLNSDGVSF